MDSLILKDVVFSLKEFNLEISTTISINGITAITGASGSAKTTLLRCIAGVSNPNAGIIKFNNQTWFDNKINIPVFQRKIGYVFQEANLFSHLNIRKNLEYGFIRNKFNNPFQVDKIINEFNIKHLINRYPQQLSGGEKQKIAICRAILSNPQLFLMDEPLASVDEDSKSEILNFIKTLNQNYKIPILYVSHSQTEVSRLASQIIKLERGKIIENYETKKDVSLEISKSFPNS